MANKKHLKILRQGVDVWNDWRKKTPELLTPNLREANLRSVILDGVNLQGTDLFMADLEKAKLRGADLRKAQLWVVDLRGADLTGANLTGAYLEGSDFTKANLSKAILTGADLTGAYLDSTDLSGADLSGADLEGAQLIRTNLRKARLTGSFVYGVSVWDIKLDKHTKQQNLIITPTGITDPEPDKPVMPVITVDNIKVAQFIYLLLNNQEIRDILDTITSKAVLILGRFSKKRKAVLDAIRKELRNHNYLPIMFDFEATTNQAITETVKTLAGMSRFVIADLTDARSVSQELQIIDTHCRTVAVRLIKKRGAREYGMLNFDNSCWFVKGRYEYKNQKEVIYLPDRIGIATDSVAETGCGPK